MTFIRFFFCVSVVADLGFKVVGAINGTERKLRLPEKEHEKAKFKNNLC